MEESIMRGNRKLTVSDEPLEPSPKHGNLIVWRWPLITLDRYLSEKLQKFEDYIGFTFCLEIRKMRRLRGENSAKDE
jgi:hypothetical protein